MGREYNSPRLLKGPNWCRTCGGAPMGPCRSPVISERKKIIAWANLQRHRCPRHPRVGVAQASVGWKRVFGFRKQRQRPRLGWLDLAGSTPQPARLPPHPRPLPRPRPRPCRQRHRCPRQPRAAEKAAMWSGSVPVNSTPTQRRVHPQQGTLSRSLIFVPSH